MIQSNREPRLKHAAATSSLVAAGRTAELDPATVALSGNNCFSLPVITRESG
jgi:hypothetical protein